eukprot:Partr_v1_DN28428_c0_g1_i2_m41075 putative sarcolemma associated protein
MENLRDKVKSYFGAKPPSRSNSPTQQLHQDLDGFGGASGSGAVESPHLSHSFDLQQQQHLQQQQQVSGDTVQLSSSSSLPPNSSLAHTHPPSTAVAWGGLFGSGRRQSREAPPPAAAPSSSGRRSSGRNSDSRRRHSGSPNRRSAAGGDHDIDPNYRPVIPNNRQSTHEDDPAVIAYQRPMSDPSGTASGGLDIADESFAPAGSMPIGSGHAADYRFPVGQPCRLRLIPYNPYFPTVDKEMMNGMITTIGRYQRTQPAEDPYRDGIYFRSTVVSRKHALLIYQDGEFFIRDTKSLGGTFINSTRLSAAGKDSNPHKIFHGDVIQFGVDYRPDQRTGQVRNKDKCVELLVEFPNVLKARKRKPKPPKWDPKTHTHTECCICISALYTKQALFIAPCAHSYHYRCIAPLLRGKGFSCPMCRQESDLQESVWSLDEISDDDKAPSPVIPASIPSPSLPSDAFSHDHEASRIIVNEVPEDVDRLQRQLEAFNLRRMQQASADRERSSSDQGSRRFTEDEYRQYHVERDRDSQRNSLSGGDQMISPITSSAYDDDTYGLESLSRQIAIAVSDEPPSLAAVREGGSTMDIVVSTHVSQNASAGPPVTVTANRPARSDSQTSNFSVAGYYNGNEEPPQSPTNNPDTSTPLGQSSNSSSQQNNAPTSSSWSINADPFVAGQDPFSDPDVDASEIFHSPADEVGSNNFGIQPPILLRPSQRQDTLNNRSSNRQE